jgi:hypothetical protein
MAALSALLLAGCSNAGSGSTTTQSSSGRVAAQDSGASAGAPNAPGGGDVTKSGAQGFSATPGGTAVPGGAAAPAEPAKRGTPLVGAGQKLTKSASLDLRVKNIESAAARVRAIATGLSAQVVSEQIGNGSPAGPVPLQNGTEQGAPTSGDPGVSAIAPDSGAEGVLTLSVPADKLDAALDQLARVGTVLRRNTSSQDVTAQFVDTESRLKTMRASVQRVRALMSQAKDLGQVVALEGELSQREADLESLESQQEALKASVARSPLTVLLHTPGNEPVVTTGFVAGLRSGWNAFIASAGGLFTGIGAVVPFILFFALLGAPVVWLLRQRRTRTVAPANS